MGKPRQESIHGHHDMSFQARNFGLVVEDETEQIAVLRYINRRGHRRPPLRESMAQVERASQPTASNGVKLPLLPD